MISSKALLPSLVLTVALAGAAHAQVQYLVPGGSVPDGRYEQAQSMDAAGTGVRVDRLENQIRSLNGQIEQMQFQIKRLEDQLRKFQQDVDFRFEEKGGKAGPAARPGAPPPAAPGRRSELNENGYPVVGQTSTPVEPAAPMQTATTRGGRRGDAFDPSADPTAPGAPRDLTNLPAGANAAPPAPPSANTRYNGPLPTGPLASEADDGFADDPNAPLDLMRRPGQNPQYGSPTASLNTPVGANVAPQAPAPRVIAAPPAAQGLGAAQQTASIPQTTVADDYELGTAALKEGQYEVAEQRFRSYLEKHPKDRLTADATFYLGESYFRRSRPREAAEQYLKVSTDFPRATRAPESLVKLGLALEKLGAKEQACAAFGEVGRKYPAASSSVRTSAEREIKRAQC